MAIYDYTEANLAAIRAAKIAYATGARKVRLSWGDKSMEYAVTNMAELDSMESQIISGLETSTTRPRFFLTSTDKGL